MKKTLIMIAAFAILFGAALACSTSPKADPDAPMDDATEESQ